MDFGTILFCLIQFFVWGKKDLEYLRPASQTTDAPASPGLQSFPPAVLRGRLCVPLPRAPAPNLRVAQTRPQRGGAVLRSPEFWLLLGRTERAGLSSSRFKLWISHLETTDLVKYSILNFIGLSLEKCNHVLNLPSIAIRRGFVPIWTLWVSRIKAASHRALAFLEF